MVKLEATIHPSRADAVKAELRRLGVASVAVSQVWMHNNSPEARTFYRGAEYVCDAPYTKLELLISSLQLDEITSAILDLGRTEMRGDTATIAVFELADAFQIRNGRRISLTTT